MRRILLFVMIAGMPLLCAAATTGSLKAYAQEEESGPRVWDFGKIPAGTKAQHVFVFKNEGAQKLTIKNVSTSCGCTASKVDKTELKPGEETEINVTFNSSAYNGPVKQFVYVNTDSTTEPLVRFTVKADVQRK